jgi:hypothetical protein
MTGLGPDSVEGCVNGRSTHSIKHDIEALTFRVERDPVERES